MKIFWLLLGSNSRRSVSTRDSQPDRNHIKNPDFSAYSTSIIRPELPAFCARFLANKKCAISFSRAAIHFWLSRIQVLSQKRLMFVKGAKKMFVLQ